jgi:hypothetical protein
MGRDSKKSGQSAIVPERAGARNRRGVIWKNCDTTNVVPAKAGTYAECPKTSNRLFDTFVDIRGFSAPPV